MFLIEYSRRMGCLSAFRAMSRHIVGGVPGVPSVAVCRMFRARCPGGRGKGVKRCRMCGWCGASDGVVSRVSARAVVGCRVRCASRAYCAHVECVYTSGVLCGGCVVIVLFFTMFFVYFPGAAYIPGRVSGHRGRVHHPGVVCGWCAWVFRDSGGSVPGVSRVRVLSLGESGIFNTYHA